MNISAQDVWGQVLSILQQRVEAQSYRTWFVPIKPLKIEQSTLTIQIPNRFFYEWLEEHYVDVLRQALLVTLGPNARLEYLIKKEMPAAQPVVGSKAKPYGLSRDLEKNYLQTPIRNNEQIKNPFAIPGIQKLKINSQLNPDYNFGNYIEGDCNRLARAAGLAIGKKPGTSSFNPLMIYSEVGLGKTHLAHAIGNEVKLHHPSKTVLYVSAEQFGNQFVDAVKNNSSNDFVHFYSQIDVLIVDDIQFLSNKSKTQDIFFSIFNALHQNGKQLVFTCDRPPQKLQGIEDRLMSRFKWGLSADLQLPAPETRLAIVQQKMEHDGVDLPYNVAEYISISVRSNVRELEGVLISLLAESAINQRDIDIHLAHDVIQKCVAQVSEVINVDFVTRLVADFYKLKPSDLIEAGRKKAVVSARHTAMYLAKTICDLSLSEIGRVFGNRDHTTVLHACQSVEELLQKDMLYKQIFEQISQKIRNTLS